MAFRQETDTASRAIDLDRLRHDPLMKITVGRCPQTGAPLASQSTISRLENSPSKTDAARRSAAMVDQFCATVKPGRIEIFDIDDTFCAAHGGQQLAFWNAHRDERGFASMHIYHVASGAPVATILRPARTPKGTEEEGRFPGRHRHRDRQHSESEQHFSASAFFRHRLRLVLVSKNDIGVEYSWTLSRLLAADCRAGIDLCHMRTKLHAIRAAKRRVTTW